MNTESWMLLAPSDKLDIEKTFECGQCFRWNSCGTGMYSGVAGKYPALLRTDGGNVYICSAAPDCFWQSYFDLETDYTSAEELFIKIPYLADCTEYGRGIRILRQEPWEALCSFIISQCNNIPRIKGIVEKLCAIGAEKVGLDGREFFTFPSAQTVSEMTENDLAPLRAGYRVPYILSAAKAVVSGSVDLKQLAEVSYGEAVRELMRLDGVGAKVANCVVLFGLHHLEAFPIDVWIRRSLNEHFPPGFDPSSLGPLAGLAQQYVFFYARNGRDGAL